MKRLTFTILIVGWLGLTSLPAITTDQSIPLDTGWNAVWLEVDPVVASGENAGLNQAVTDVFSDNAIEIVATPVDRFSSAEFISSPNDPLSHGDRWRLWRRSSVLAENTLAVVEGYRPYFVKVSSDITLIVTGEARYFEPSWDPFSYQLIGFGLTGSVTFGEFFADAPQHPTNRIFQLNPANGNWEAVRSTTSMVSGRAYWIYTDGTSDFTGPVKIGFRGTLGIDFGDEPATLTIPDPESTTGGTLDVVRQELALTNISSWEQTVTLVKVDPDTGANSLTLDSLRIFDLAPAADGLAFEIGEGLLNDTAIIAPAEATTIVTLGADRSNWTATEPRLENLYRIEFEHHYAWLPMAASDPDRSEATVTAADPEAVGLWVGEVLLREVTSTTEAGRPVRPTGSVAPVRVIIHVDDSGEARLLRDVLVMQTKTASESIAPERVLVVNEAQVPFYEGILERGGKRVGLRIETVGYDLPRAFDPTTQQALVNTVGTALSIADPADVTAANIQEWVEDQSTRPTSLVESYAYHWPLAGSLTAGGELTGTLSMDAFHRTNPFRHAFHPSHGTGRVLARAITIDLDSSAPGAGLLTGRYEETITGLGAVPLTTSRKLDCRKFVSLGWPKPCKNHVSGSLATFVVLSINSY